MPVMGTLVLSPFEKGRSSLHLIKNNLFHSYKIYTFFNRNKVLSDLQISLSTVETWGHSENLNEFLNCLKIISSGTVVGSN